MIGERDAIRKLRKAGAEVMRREDGSVGMVRLPDGRQYKTAREALAGQAVSAYPAWQLVPVGSGTLVRMSWSSADAYVQGVIPDFRLPSSNQIRAAVAAPEKPKPVIQQPVVRRLRVGEP